MSSPQTILRGRVIDVAFKEVGANNAPLRTVAVETGNRHPNPLEAEFFGEDMAEKAKPIEAGCVVEIECYVNGRQGHNRRFISLRANKVAIIEARPHYEPTDDSGESVPQEAYEAQETREAEYDGGDEDNLPF